MAAFNLLLLVQTQIPWYKLQM